MKKIIAIIITIIFVFLLTACGMNSVDDVGGTESASYAGIGGGVGGYGSGTGISNKIKYDGSAMESIRVSDDGIPYVTEEGGYIEEEEDVQAGQMTAKAWNDNDHFEAWKKLFAAATDNDPEGKLHYYTKDSEWAYDTFKRVTVTVTESGAAVVGAEVTYFDASQRKYTVRTDVSGVAYLFPQEDAGTLTVKSGTGEITVAFTAEEKDVAVELSGAEAQANVIKLMFVIDATGSMGDEMRYIEAELADVVHRVAAQTEQVRIDLALLFYRDTGDQEKFAYHDFTNVTEEKGLSAQLRVLAAQRAEGGGDYPEAVDEALALAMGKDWGDENSTKLMFLVLDAPPHAGYDQRDCLTDAVRIAAEKGIRICPVLCSGADDLCEYVTRMSALVTGGTSVFVTDDSGIGGEHLDPDLPDATVEKLNDLMVRLIVGYHTGDFGTAVAWDADQVQEGREQVSGAVVAE